MLPGDVEAGERLVSHPDVAMIHFTGSTTVGRRIAQTAAGQLKKVSLELGGNNALLVLEDADIDQATMIGAWSAFHYQGQTCITAGRHIVHRAVAGAYLSGLAARAEAITVGNTVTEEVGLGPMINARQLERARQMLERGGRGRGPGRGRRHDGRPVLPAHRGGGREPVQPPLDRGDLRSHRAGAGGGRRRQRPCRSPTTPPTAWSTRCSPPTWPAGMRVARQLRAGMVHVNDATPQDEALAPFGGMGASGLGGRSGGEANLEEFTQRRWLTVAPGPVHYPY